MATLSQLVAGIATVQGIDGERVGAIARALREDGFIQTLGRGTSAAQMSEPDAANLLIGASMADTARTAPAAVAQYRALIAKRDNQTSEFGGELEKMISAAKLECFADYMKKMVALLGTRGNILGKRRFHTEEYRISIEFEKPVPSVRVGISTWKASNPADVVAYFDRSRRLSTEAGADRTEVTRMTQRTIHAVADVLRM